MRGLHKDLQRITTKLPFFPPKKIVGKNDVEFIRTRHRQLHSYFERLSTELRVEKLNCFIDFFNFNQLKEKWNRETQRRLASSTR